MDNETGKRAFCSPCNKPRAYSRRTRPGRPRTRARIDGTTSRKQRGPTCSNDIQEDPLVIPFPVPASLPTDWLLRMAPVALARHLLYSRGLWPMSVPQLILLQNQEQQVSNNSCYTHDLDSSVNTTNNKRQRMNKSNRISPSLRRKQRRAMDQITRLCDQWYDALACCEGSENGKNGHNNDLPAPISSLSSALSQQSLQEQPQTQHRSHFPAYVLVSLGSSYGQSKELYLLDFQSLFDDDQLNNRNGVGVETKELTGEREQKVETMLTRKLISALMNHTADGDQESPMNSLPSTTSPSFRLWFTAGFEACNSEDDDEKSARQGRTTHTGRTPNPPRCDYSPDPDTTDPTNPAIEWIPRTKFPQTKRQSQSRPSSRKQSLVTIRFVRSLQKQQQENNNHNNSIESRSIRPQLHPVSNALTWMSLPACVKGFRL